MRPSLLVLLLAVAAASALQEVPDESQAAVAHTSQDADEPRSRPARWVVFKPMFASRLKQRQINRAMHNQELRRQWRAKGAKGAKAKRTRRALHFPTGGAGSSEESGLALRVAVNDLLFQSAPANDLPEAAAHRSAVGSGLGSSAGASMGLKPMLLARLRSASHEREPAAEEEAFLLMSTAGGRPAIVPAPTSRPLPPVRRPHKKQAHSKHKPRKGDKQRRRVTRDTTASSASPGITALLGQRLDAMEGAMRQRADGIAERVKQYDAQGVYPAYSYTHGRYTRAAVPAAPPAVSVMKVKVQGEVDDDDDEETMEVAENVVFRPLFAHRDLLAARQDSKRRRSGLAKKSTKPAAKPLRRRQPQPQGSTAVRPAAATTWFHRRTYLQHPSAGRRYQYRYSPYRRVVVYQ